MISKLLTRVFFLFFVVFSFSCFAGDLTLTQINELIAIVDNDHRKHNLRIHIAPLHVPTVDLATLHLVPHPRKSYFSTPDIRIISDHIDRVLTVASQTIIAHHNLTESREDHIFPNLEFRCARHWDGRVTVMIDHTFSVAPMGLPNLGTNIHAAGGPAPTNQMRVVIEKRSDNGQVNLKTAIPMS